LSPTGCGASARCGWSAEHERIVTGGGKASTKLPQFKAVNTFLGNLKRALGGTYHAFDFTKYAHRYLAEAQSRFNRRFNLRSPDLAQPNETHARIESRLTMLTHLTCLLLSGARGNDDRHPPHP
jgi:hypothetical protein